MKKAETLLKYSRLYVALLLMAGSFFGFPNDAALCGLYWGLMAFGEIVCIVRSR